MLRIIEVIKDNKVKAVYILQNEFQKISRWNPITQKSEITDVKKFSKSFTYSKEYQLFECKDEQSEIYFHLDELRRGGYEIRVKEYE